MKLVEYHKLREGVQINAAPGSVMERLATQDALLRALTDAGFGDVEVAHTDDADQLVIGMCTFPATAEADDTAFALSRLWEIRLRYEFWEAHTLLAGRDQVELLGSTRCSLTGHYLTFHVVAQRETVPAQRIRS